MSAENEIKIRDLILKAGGAASLCIYSSYICQKV